MHVCLLNCRSLVNKLSSLNSFVYSSKFMIFCFNETWLNDSIFNNEIIPTGYSIYRKDRSSRGGGILVAVSDLIPSFTISSPVSLEVITVSIHIPQQITLCTLYTPPCAPDDYHRSLCSYLSSLSLTSSKWETLIIRTYVGHLSN